MLKKYPEKYVEIMCEGVQWHDRPHVADMPQSWCGNSAEENHEETQLNMVGQFVLFKHASNPVPSLSCPCLQHLPHLDAYTTLWNFDKFD